MRSFDGVVRWRLALAALAACGARTELDAPSYEDASQDACGTSLASGPVWSTSFGPANPVCLTTTQPPGCPSDAFLYGLTGWNADISQLGGAVWIWRPGISLSDEAALAQVVFTRTLVLHGTPTGTLALAADDYAEIDVNGTTVGHVGSVTDRSIASAAQSALTTFDLSAYLVAGTNTITIIGRNGPATFGIGCASTCTYAQNPAGVVFGGKVECH